MWRTILHPDGRGKSHRGDTFGALSGPGGYQIIPAGSLTHAALLDWQLSCYELEVIPGHVVSQTIPHLAGDRPGVATRVEHHRGELAMPLWGTVFVGQAAVALREKWTSTGPEQGKSLIQLSSDEDTDSFMVMTAEPAWCVAALVNSCVGANEPANVAVDGIRKLHLAPCSELELVYTRDVPKGAQLLCSFAVLK